MAGFNSGSYAQSAPGPGDQLSAIDFRDVHTSPTQASNQQNTHTDIVFPHHQLPYCMLNRGEASLHTRAQDSKCEEVKEQIREELKAEIESFKQNTMAVLQVKDEELKKVMWERDVAKKELELAKEKLDFANETKEKEHADKEVQLKAKDMELKEKDQKIKELTQRTEIQEAQIKELITEKERLQKTIDEMNIQMRILNENVTNIQNQGSTLEAGLQECKEAISENSEQREEQIKNVLDKQLEKRMREMFAEMVSLNVPSATVQEAASASSKLQGDYKNVSPLTSHTTSPSRSPVNVPTPPLTPPTSTGQEQTN